MSGVFSTPAKPGIFEQRQETGNGQAATRNQQPVSNFLMSFVRFRLRISVFAPFAKQDTLKFPMGKKGIIVSQIREQDPLLAQEVSGNLILIIEEGFGDLLTKGIDDLATPPRT